MMRENGGEVKTLPIKGIGCVGLLPIQLQIVVYYI